MNACRKKWTIILISIIISMLVVITSCLDSNYDFNNISDEMELAPALSAPLAYGSLTLNDILNQLDSNEYIKQRPADSLLYIFYSDSLFTYTASEVIDIPDQDFVSFSLRPVIPVAFVLPGVGDTISEIRLPLPFDQTPIPLAFDQDLEFTFDNGEKIDSLILKSLKMKITATSNFQNDLILDFHTGNINVNGEDYKQRIKVSSVPVTLERTLNNVKMFLITTPQNASILSLKIDLGIINKGNAIRPGDNCQITMSFKDIVFSSVYGFLGEYDILSNSGQFDVSFFSNKILGGKISFSNPELVLKVNNSFGVPVQVALDMDVVSEINDPPITDIVFTGGANPFTIGAPDLENFGQSVASEIRIDTTNSNLIRALESSPDYMNYAATARINPSGVVNYYNYVTDSSKINVGVEVMLPIDLKAQGFTLEDTMEIDFEEQFGDNLDRIDYFRFTMTATNEIPLEAKLQVYFTDSLYNEIDSLFRDDDVFLEPATIGTDGKHSIGVPKVNQVEYDAAQLEKLKPVKFARIKAAVNTPGSDYFKFYSYYKLDFKLGATVATRINTNEL